MLTQDDVARLLSGLCPSEAHKRSLASAVAALDRAGVRHAIAGDLCLRVRGVVTSNLRLELAVERVPTDALKAEGFTVQGDDCERQGVWIRLRVVKPAVLDRVDRFGKLALLGAADVLRNKIADACLPGMLITARAAKIAEAARLSLAMPDAAEEVDAKLLLSRATKANDNGVTDPRVADPRVADPSRPGSKTTPAGKGQGEGKDALGNEYKTAGQELYRWIGKVFKLSVLVVVLASGPSCQLDASGLGSQTLGSFTATDASAQPKRGPAGQDGGLGEAGSDVRGQGAETSRDAGQGAEAARDAGGEGLRPEGLRPEGRDAGGAALADARRDAAREAPVDQGPDAAPKDAGDGGRGLGPDLPATSLPLGAPCKSSDQCGTNTTCTSGVCCASLSCESGCLTGCSSAGTCMICSTCTCMPATGTCHC